MVVRVKPEYNGKISIQSNTALNEIVLSNNLSQEALLSIYLNEPGLREFLYTEYTTASGSYAPSQIDPSLLHAYDASEITQNPAKTDYPAGTVGKYLNETANKINSISTIATRPQSILDFAGAKMLPSYATFMRASTASYVDVNGMIKYAKAGQPRFTHNPVTKESLGILIEETRTNSAVNSTVLLGQTNLTSSLAKAPDGTSTALLINQTIGNPIGSFSFDIPYATIGIYTRSVFLKANNTVSAKVVFEGVGGPSGSGDIVTFDVITRTFSGATNYLIDFGFEVHSDGWVRPWLCIEKSAIKIAGRNHYLEGYGGNATSTQSMFIWGYQYELGKCPTSYIPTSGAAVTRGVENLSIAAKYVPQSEGTFLASGVAPGKTESTSGGFRKVLSINNTDVIGYLPNSVIGSFDGVLQVQHTPSGGMDTIALAYNAQNRKISVSGSGIVTNNTNNISAYNNLMYIGSGNGSNSINGTIKRLTIYARMLADTELVKVTSNTISSNQAGGIPANSDLGQLAFVDATTILSAPNRQELSMDGTAASVTRNIRRPYDFSFAIVDSSGVTITSQPAVSCLANTDNALIFTAPVGKTITYAIIPYFEY